MSMTNINAVFPQRVKGAARRVSARAGAQQIHSNKYDHY
jgi:hypothetical protein